MECWSWWNSYLKIIRIKKHCKHLIGCLERIVRALVLILPKMSRYVKTFKQKNNRLVPLRIDDENEKLLKKYETIWTKIEDLKILN